MLDTFSCVGGGLAGTLEAAAARSSSLTSGGVSSALQLSTTRERMNVGIVRYEGLAILHRGIVGGLAFGSIAITQTNQLC